MAQVTPRLQVVARTEWGARPPRTSPEIPAMVHPAAIVYSTYSTDSPTCQDRESCCHCRTVREIQDRHMDVEGAPDIAYNFIVGGDQLVCEGRGWSKQPEGKHLFPDVASKLVDIAFIGDYTNQTLPYSLAKIALELVGNYINEKYLTSGYRLKESHRKLNFDED